MSELSFLSRVIARSMRSCANRRNRQTQARARNSDGQPPVKADFDATYSPVWLRAKVIAWRNKLALSNNLGEMSAYSESANGSGNTDNLLDF